MTEHIDGDASGFARVGKISADIPKLDEGNSADGSVSVGDHLKIDDGGQIALRISAKDDDGDKVSVTVNLDPETAARVGSALMNTAKSDPKTLGDLFDEE